MDGGGDEPRKPVGGEIRRTAAVMRLVGILRAQGGDMYATQATSKLYKAVPRAKEEVAAAGGLRKFCELFPVDLEFVADPEGRCRVRARRPTRGLRGPGRAELAQAGSTASSRSRSSSAAVRPSSQSGQAAVGVLPGGGVTEGGGSGGQIACGGDGAAAAAAAGALPEMGGDVPMGREAATTLQRLVGILHSGGGEMYAARAPKVRPRFHCRQGLI